MMRKILAFLLVSICAITCVFGVSSCSLMKGREDGEEKEEHIHDFSTEWTTDKNYHWYECLIDGCDEITDKREHFLDSVKECEPTCKMEGNIAYYKCRYCDLYFSDKKGENLIENKTDVILPKRHSTMLVPEIKSTCMDYGNKAYYICNFCDGWFEDEAGTIEITDQESVKLPKKHSLKLVPEKEANCLSSAKKAYYICDFCSGWFEDEEGTIQITDKESIKLGKYHKLTFIPEEKSTCSKLGRKAYYTCDECGEWFGDENGTDRINFKPSLDIPPLEHLYEKDICTVCGQLRPTEGLSYSISIYDDYCFVEGIGTAKDTDIIIAANYYGKPVKGIRHFAFQGCDKIVSVTIPDSVTFIGESAFEGCVELTSVTIGRGVQTIYDFAFRGCVKLESITILDSVTSIGNFAFKGCVGLKSITVDSNNTVYLSARNCLIKRESKTLISAFKDSIIPDDGSVACISAFAFENYVDLKTITIPAEVTSIDNSAFRGCIELTDITVESGNSVYHSTGNCIIETGTKTLILGCHNSVIPDDGSVKHIANSAFMDCRKLTSIIIPDGVTDIGMSAFSGCEGLTEVAIGSDATSIGESAFLGCGKLTSIIIPDDVTGIGEKTFEGCVSLKSVTIGKGVASIGSWAFLDCIALESVIVPDSVTSIGISAFEGCEGLTSITLPFVGAEKDGTENTHFGYIFGATTYLDHGKYVPASLMNVVLTGGSSIGESAFASCSKLTDITIPNSVMSIANDAFKDCNGITNITVGSGNTIYLSVGNCLIDRESKTLILACNGSVIPDDGSVMHIGDFAFANCDSLTSIIVPESVTSIASSAFKGCSKLTSITLPFVGAEKNGTENTHFGYIFGASSSTENSTCIPTLLKTVIITGGSSIGENAFEGCEGLTSVILRDGITSIGFSAFKGCNGLTDITLPFVGAEKDGTENTHFGYIFGASTYSKNSINVPASLKTVIITGGSSISRYAFFDCRNLTSVTISDSVTSIGMNAFDDCDNLASITLPFVGAEKDGTEHTHFGYIFGASTYLKNKMFVPMSLKKVVITGGSSISEYAFLSCSGLTSVAILNDGVPSIGESAFSGCANLESIIIPDSVTSIGRYAFDGCGSLKTVYYKGTEEDWANVIINKNNNSSLTDATKYYYSQTEPAYNTNGTYIGNFWHYDADGITPVIWKKKW